MTMKTAPYDVIKDFAPVALVAKAPLAIAVNKNLPVTDVKSLIAHAKANPGKLTFAIGSTGSAGHLSTELLRRASGIEYLIVPYKGSAPAYQDLIGGQIDGFIDPILGSASYAKAGQLRVIAITSKTRVPSLPDVPTVGETVPGYEFYSWYGLWGPANLPKDIAQRLNTEVNKALATDMREKLTQQGLLLTPGSIDDFVAFQKDDMARAAEDRRRREDPCRVMPGRAARSSPAAARASVRPSPSDCWPTAGACTASTWPRRASSMRRFKPLRVDLTDGAATAAAARSATTCRRSCMPPACCAWHRSASCAPRMPS